MDRRKFLKNTAAAAMAGAAMVLPSCSDSDFFPPMPDRKDRRSGRNKDKNVRSTSLFTASDRHEMGEGNNLPALVEKVVDQADVVPQVVLLGGDYVGGGRVMTPEFTINDLYNEVYSVLEAPTCDALFTYGSHDKCCTEGYSAFFSGPRRCDGYYIYGITYVQVACATDADAEAAVRLHGSLLRSGADYSEFEDDDIILTKSGYSGIDIADRYGKSAESATASFLKWLDTLDDNAPIVVMSHMPLHYNRGDNFGGLKWYEALSKAAEKHDVIFLWGHNHTIEEKASDYSDRTDEKMKDRFYYMLTPSDFLTHGDTIDIQGASKDEVVSEKLNFSYANAGYIKLGYGTLITFSGNREDGAYDSMTIHRYGIDSVPAETEIGFTGKSNPFTLSLQKTSSSSSKGRI